MPLLWSHYACNTSPVRDLGKSILTLTSPKTCFIRWLPLFFLILNLTSKIPFYFSVVKLLSPDIFCTIKLSSPPLVKLILKHNYSRGKRVGNKERLNITFISWGKWSEINMTGLFFLQTLTKVKIRQDKLSLKVSVSLSVS